MTMRIKARVCVKTLIQTQVVWFELLFPIVGMLLTVIFPANEAVKVISMICCGWFIGWLFQASDVFYRFYRKNLRIAKCAYISALLITLEKEISKEHEINE